ncbi:MAG: 5-oxoprolinase subunit PxpB [bacterium]
MGLYREPLLRLMGDRGVLLEYGDSIEPEVNLKVRTMAALLESRPIKGILEAVPTYRSLLIIYDPMLTEPQSLRESLRALEKITTQANVPPPRLIEIPVCYGGELGPDIEFVANYHKIKVDEVIRIHSSPCYQIYMMGFTPGFPFLGVLPKILETPRLDTPRLHVPAGSVAIASNQTGIYPISSPGGWRLIGRTPIKLFRPEEREPFLYKAGDLIKFIPVDRKEFDALAQRQL